MSNTFAEALDASSRGSVHSLTCCLLTLSGHTCTITCEFRSRLGPLFTNILLADEINRASKTRKVLLEAKHAILAESLTSYRLSS